MIESYYNKTMVVRNITFGQDTAGGPTKIYDDQDPVPCRSRNLSGIQTEYLSRNADEIFERVYCDPGVNIKELDEVRIYADAALQNLVYLGEVRRINLPAQFQLQHHFEIDVEIKTPVAG